MEVEFDPELDDQEQLVRLVIRQKNMQQVAKLQAAPLLRWAARHAQPAQPVARVPAAKALENQVSGHSSGMLSEKL